MNPEIIKMLEALNSGELAPHNFQEAHKEIEDILTIATLGTEAAFDKKNSLLATILTNQGSFAIIMDHICQALKNIILRESQEVDALLKFANRNNLPEMLPEEMPKNENKPVACLCGGETEIKELLRISHPGDDGPIEYKVRYQVQCLACNLVGILDSSKKRAITQWDQTIKKAMMEKQC